MLPDLVSKPYFRHNDLKTPYHFSVIILAQLNFLFAIPSIPLFHRRMENVPDQPLRREYLVVSSYGDFSFVVIHCYYRPF